LPGMAARSPVRIVLDSALRLQPGSRLARTAKEVPVWVITQHGTGAAQEPLLAAGVEVLNAPATRGRPDLGAVLRLLADRGITRVMVEAGPILAAALLAADLVDEAMLFQSPKVVGPDGIDALEGLPLTALTQSPALVGVRSAALGADSYEFFERR
jgi:diaminohydroxyphosphoribosylaminopyrimidine deaminase / 5-amino-6-(5-phosphoribosylamino)uracil reductase